MGVVGSAWACSSDSGGGPASSGGDSGNDAGAATAGSESHAGSQATGGATNTAGAAQGGVSSSEGGAAHEGGSGADQASAGAGNESGAGSPPVGGAGGADGAEVPGPPDLITSSGGPWPDSLTGACENAAKIISCPQKDSPFFGQDGSYRINVPKYTTTGTTLKDSVTGLTWQLSPELVGKIQADAVAYCEALELGGQTDWRLPTRLEFVTVLDEGNGSGTAMPPGFPVTGQGAQWTASATGLKAGQFFVMDDQVGQWTIAVADTALTARCVRGPSLTGARTVDTDFVTDSMTSLAWQTTNLDDTLRSWEEALDYCETLTHAEKDDWRLPNIKELATLVDETALQAPVIAADFGSSTAAQVWSSTPAPTFGTERFAFALDTGLGSSPSLKMSESAAAARCVRSAD
jgi:Protein of unknown function (DUF1566)